MNLISTALISLLLGSISLNATTLLPTNPKVHHSGRIEMTPSGTSILGYSGARMRLAFSGGTVTVKMRSIGEHNWINVILDGERIYKHKLTSRLLDYTLNEALPPGIHTLEIVKATEGYEGKVEISEITLSEGNQLLPCPWTETRAIEFIGDSITCGYGIEANDREEHWSPDTENFCDTYAWLTAQELHADYLVVARSGIGMLRNYNGPHDGSVENLPYLYDRTFFHDPEPKWDYSKFTPDVVCINLGTNDFSTTGVDSKAYEAAYLSFVERLLENYPEAKIVCLLGPMLNDPNVKTILERIAATANSNLRSPQVFHFEMTTQGPLGYGADWHPSKAQAALNAKELTAYLRGLMHW